MSVKYEIEKFDGKISFSLWRVKMHAILVQQGSQKALWPREQLLKKETDDKASTATTTDVSTVAVKTVSDVEFVEIDERARSVIILNLADKVLCEVVEENTTLKLWQKLESLYMTKSLTNRLFLKQNLYTLQMKEGTLVKEHIDAFN